MAPEVMRGKEYSQKADVFSYSIILWEIVAREPPYKGINSNKQNSNAGIKTVIT